MDRTIIFNTEMYDRNTTTCNAVSLRRRMNQIYGENMDNRIYRPRYSYISKDIQFYIEWDTPACSEPIRLASNGIQFDIVITII